MGNLYPMIQGLIKQILYDGLIVDKFVIFDKFVIDDIFDDFAVMNLRW